MAYKIIEECVACDACYEACLFQAVRRDFPVYSIDWEKCTECTSLYRQPQCSEACPLIGGCIPDTEHPYN